jgi:hypothetical protein
MKVRIFVAVIAFTLGSTGFVDEAFAGKCVVIQPDHDRVCGNGNAQELRTFEEIGGCFEIHVKAASKWNASGVRLVNGESYAFELVEPNGKWHDKSLDANALGWTPDAIESLSGFNAFVMAALEPLRRAPDQDWFYLMGMVAEVGQEIFPIGEGASALTVQEAGEFCAFANDLPWMYRNNQGSLHLRVTRASK